MDEEFLEDFPIPLDKPNPSRMYDYFLGGHHNFAVDRAAAEQVLAAILMPRWSRRPTAPFSAVP